MKVMLAQNMQFPGLDVTDYQFYPEIVQKGQ